MRIKKTTAAIVILSAASLFAQSAPSPVPMPSAPRGVPTMPMRKAGANHGLQRMLPTPEAMQAQQIKELEDTVSKMQALLRQMQIKARGSKDQATLNNLRMWELLVSHMSETLGQARLVAAERADFIARREALYKQAYAKADAEAARAKAEKFGAASAPQTSAPGSSAPQKPAPVSQSAAPKK